jgi:hypothetical protein
MGKGEGGVPHKMEIFLGGGKTARSELAEADDPWHYAPEVKQREQSLEKYIDDYCKRI